MTSPDMAQYLGVFLDEAQEQLALLETHILAMERGDHSAERLQTLFRAAHTLKGSSRAMGFLGIGDLTHEMENVLDALRLNSLAVSTPIINALLDCLDALGALTDAVARTGADSESGGHAIPALVARLAALRQETLQEMLPRDAAPAGRSENAAPAGQPNTPTGEFLLTDYERVSLRDAREAGLTACRIDIVLRDDCLMKSIRVFMVLGALEPLGSVLACCPGEEALEAEAFDRAFSLLAATGRPLSDLEAALNTISELESVAVGAWAEEAAPPSRSVRPLPGENPSPEAKAREPEARAGLSPGDGASSGHTIRVDVARLDALLNLVGEMVIDRAQAARLSHALRARYPHEAEAEELTEVMGRIARTTGEMQNEIMKARMLPVDGVFQRMPRMIRDLAQKTGKEIEFQISGGETELDRSVLENLGDPLIHLLRNSADHGIEPPDERVAAGKAARGRIRLTARHQESQIIMEISDDGRGMDPAKLKAAAVRKGLLTEAAAEAMGDKDALNLIFASGFSTAQAVSDISGRGVGMDIVRANLEKIGGRILVESVIGQGSRFQIVLPLTLAIVRALLVAVGRATYVLPLNVVVEIVQLGQGGSDCSQITVGGQAALSLRGRTVPLASLSHALTGDPQAVFPEAIAPDSFVVIVGFAERQVGLCVEELAGEQEVVIKSLGTLLGDIPGICGATILGNGQVALIVDAAQAVAAIAGMTGRAPRQAAP